jgi:hypothetical protein
MKQSQHITIALLLFIIIILACSLAFIKPYYIENNEVIIKLISTLLNSTVFIGVAIFSYFKFFKVRTLSENLTISATAKILAVKNSISNSIFLNIKIDNIGNVAITNYEIKMTLSVMENEAWKKIQKIKPQEGNRLEGYTEIIEPQAVVNIHTFHGIDENIQALKYVFTLTSDKGNIWSKVVTVPNSSAYVYEDK